MGTWQHGRAHAPVVLRVPLGIVVRELPRGHPRHAWDEREAEPRKKLAPDSTRKTVGSAGGIAAGCTTQRTRTTTPPAQL
jgi:hypothetical protein